MTQALREIVRNHFRKSSRQAALYPSSRSGSRAAWRSCTSRNPAASMRSTSTCSTARFARNNEPALYRGLGRGHHAARPCARRRLCFARARWRRHGVTVPDIESAAEAAKVVARCKFEPAGERSTGGGLPQLQYRSWLQTEVVEVMNEATTVFVNIENLTALDAIDDIAAVPGLDVLMIGNERSVRGIRSSGPARPQARAGCLPESHRRSPQARQIRGHRRHLRPQAHRGIRGVGRPRDFHGLRSQHDYVSRNGPREIREGAERCNG